MNHLEILQLTDCYFYKEQLDLTDNSSKNGRCVWNTDFDFITFINIWTGAEQGLRKCEYRLTVRPDDYKTWAIWSGY